MKKFYLLFTVWLLALFPLYTYGGNNPGDHSSSIYDQDEDIDSLEVPAEEQELHDATQGIFASRYVPADPSSSNGGTTGQATNLQTELRKIVLKDTVKSSNGALKSAIEDLFRRHSSNKTTQDAKFEFNAYWRDSVMNCVYDQPYLSASNDAKEPGASLVQRTTLLNEFLRLDGVTDHAAKVLTLLEYGASKNLAPDFDPAPISSQAEYPLQIVLFELWKKAVNVEKTDDGLTKRLEAVIDINKNPEDYALRQIKVKEREAFINRAKIIEHLFNDKVKYVKPVSSKNIDGNQRTMDEKLGINSDLRTYSEESETITPTFMLVAHENINYCLLELFRMNDFNSFDVVLGYLEKKDIHAMEPVSHGGSQLDKEYYSPILESVLESMYSIRMLLAKRMTPETNADGSAVDSDDEEDMNKGVYSGKNRYTDLIQEFFSSKELQAYLKSKRAEHHVEKFSSEFQKALAGSAYDEDFGKVEKSFRAAHKKSDIVNDHQEAMQNALTAEDIKPLILRYVQIAQFRTRLDVHINLYGLVTANVDTKAVFTSQGSADSASVFETKSKNAAKKALDDQDDADDEEPVDDSGVTNALANAMKLRRFVEPKIPHYQDLRLFDGVNMIFNGYNNRGWSPIMYTVANRGAEQLQLLMNHPTFDYTPFTEDTFGCNLFHIALGLGEEGIKKLASESSADRMNALLNLAPRFRTADYDQKTLETIIVLLYPNDKRDEKRNQKVKAWIEEALATKSQFGVTPLAQAAAMGLMSSYEKMETFLKESNRGFNPKEHMYQDTEVDQLYQRALLSMKLDDDDKVDASDAKSQKIREQRKMLKERMKLAQRANLLPAYNEKDPAAQSLEREIYNAAKAKWDEVTGNGMSVTTKAGECPWGDALKAALEIIEEGKDETKTEWVDAPAAKLQKKEEPELTVWEKMFGRKAPPEDAVKEKPAPKKVPKTVPNPRYPLYVAKGKSKASYFKNTLRFYLADYIKQHDIAPGKVSEWTDIYQGLTEDPSMTFFANYGANGQEFEDAMRDLIKAYLAEEKLLKVEKKVEANKPVVSRFVIPKGVQKTGQGQPKS